jgi:hypothetical protein
MMFSSRLRSSYAPAFALVLVVASVACNAGPRDVLLDASSDDLQFRPRPPHVDAGSRPDATSSSPDAGGGGVGGGGTGGGTAAGVVSCYLGGFPNTTCARPSHCCFSNFTAAHDGECSMSTCGWGTIECDGPEDCAGGQHCCAHVLQDPENGITGYAVSCQAAACGAAPANEELCHPASSATGTCSGSRACVSALDNDYDLPRSLYVCR